MIGPLSSVINCNRSGFASPLSSEMTSGSMKLLLAQARQRIDTFTTVYGLHRHQDAHLRSDLNHASP